MLVLIAQEEKTTLFIHNIKKGKLGKLKTGQKIYNTKNQLQLMFHLKRSIQMEHFSHDFLKIDSRAPKLFITKGTKE